MGNYRKINEIIQSVKVVIAFPYPFPLTQIKIFKLIIIFFCLSKFRISPPLSHHHYKKNNVTCLDAFFYVLQTQAPGVTYLSRNTKNILLT